MKSALASVAALTVLVLPVLSAAQVPTTPAIKAQVAEFPLYDDNLASRVEAGLLRQRAIALGRTDPTSPERMRILGHFERVDEMLSALRLLPAQSPERIADVLDAFPDALTRPYDRDGVRDVRKEVTALLEPIVERVPSMPREVGGRVAYRLYDLEALNGFTFQSAAPRALESYRRTAAHVMAYGLWLARKDSPPARFVEMDAYIKRFAGQPVAARLLAAKAADLAYNSSVYWRSESDPTERVLALLDVVKQIESGPYAGSPWIEQAVITVAQSDLSQSLRVSEENRFRLRAAYMDFLRDHVGLARTPAWLNFRLASFVRRHVAPLENPDDPDATVETVLTGMTRFGLSADEASLATAQYYLRPHGVSPERWPALVEKGTAIVSRLAAQGGDRYAARKALAILASKAFYDGRLDDARTLYDRYVRRYPSSAWAWVAALRSAQTFEAEGDRRAAIAAFRRVSNRYRDQPLARVLGRYFAGSQFEVLGDFDSARAEYRVAMGGWDDAYGNMYDAPASEGFRNVPAGEVYLSPSRRITKAALAARIDALAVLSRPGGDLLVRARWQQEHRQFSQASATFAEYLKIHPRSPEASEVLRERHAALLRAAVWLAAIEAPGRDLPRARAMLDELSAEPFGFYVVAADIAKATLLRSEGATSESEALVSAALERLIEAQRPLRERAPVDALEADARAIRAVLFQPRRPRPFALVNPTMTFVDSSGTRTTRQVLQSLPAAGRAVFVTAEEQSALGEIIAALGGSRTRQRTSVMDTFNIPAGASVDVAAFWGQFFAIEPWTWGGWVIGGDPSIGTVTFLDEARTRAVVEISQGSGGSTIVMEKSEGEWRSVGVRNSWVT